MLTNEAALFHALLQPLNQVAWTLASRSLSRSRYETERLRLLLSGNLRSLQDEFLRPRSRGLSHQERLTELELLYFLEKHVIAHDDGAFSDDEGCTTTLSEYTNVVGLCRRLSTLNNDAGHQDPLQDHILLRNLGPDSLESLCARVEDYRKALKRSSENTEDHTWRQALEGRAGVEEWTAVGPVFRGLENFAYLLKRYWIPQRCLISPRFSVRSTPGPVSCWLIGPNQDNSWYKSRLTSKSAEQSHTSRSKLCDFVELEAENSIESSVSSTDKRALANGPQPLDTWLDRNRERLSLKRRLTLALRVSYAYLHLNDGPLWRADTFDFQLISDWPSAIDQPIFALSSDDAISLSSGSMSQDMNRAMPSLPLLSKFIYEIVTDRQTSWETFRHDLDGLQYEEDIPFNTELYNTIRSCLDEAFKTGGTIRKHRHLRMRFLSTVVLELQYVLEKGFRVRVDDVFGTPLNGSSPRREIATNSGRTNRVITLARPGCLPQASTPTPSSYYLKCVDIKDRAHDCSSVAYDFDNDGEQKPHHDPNEMWPADQRLVMPYNQNNVAKASSYEGHKSISGASMPSIGQYYTGNTAQDQARVIYGNVYIQGDYNEHRPVMQDNEIESSKKRRTSDHHE